jgi:diguanylate cyclase (GGDEF)-like protein
MSVVCSGTVDPAASASGTHTSGASHAERLYAAVLLVAAVAALLWHIRLLPAGGFLAWLALAPLAVAGGRFRLSLPGNAAGLSVSMASAADLAALIGLGPAAAMATAVAGVLAERALAQDRPPLTVTIVNAAVLVVSVALASVALGLLGGASVPLASLAAASTYYLSNAALGGVGAALARGARTIQVIRDVTAGAAVHAFISLGTGLAAGHLLHSANAAAALVVLPSLYLVYTSYRSHLERLSEADVQVREVTALRRHLLAGDTERVAAGQAPAGGLFEDVMLAHREVHALYDIAHSMGTQLDVADTMTLISSKLSSLVPFSSCALFLEAGEGVLSCRFATGLDRERLERVRVARGQGLVGWVARHQRPLVNARPSADFEAAGISGETTLESVLMCPLVFSGRLIGALAVYHAAAGSFTDDHRRLLERVCEQAAAVVHNSTLYEQTKREALTDAMTGLPNTRFLYTHVSRELSRAERHKSNVSLLVLDLDGFKEINDRHGHHAGDRALREVARVLAEAIRPYDICVRYAGDEFVVVLSDCGPADAEAKRLELQRAIAAVSFEAGNGREVTLGCSCGSASFPRDGANYESLLALADRRMYEDKHKRKRQAETATATPAAPRPSVFAKIAPERPTTRLG